MDYLPVAHIRAIQDQIAVYGSGWLEAKVGSTRLVDRKWVEIFNRSPYKVYYSYDNTASVKSSFAIKAGGKLIVPLSECVPIYLRCGTSGGAKIIVAEVA
jgi:hypothetical protein